MGSEKVMSEAPSTSETTATTTKAPAKAPAAESAPPSGTASAEHVESADQTTSLKSLAKMAKVDEDQFDQPENQPADQTNVETIDGHEAAKTEGAELGPYGAAVPGVGEVGGGNLAKVLDPPPDLSKRNVPMVKERAAMLSPVGQKLAGFVNRPPTEWGLLGPGDTIRGHMFLLDLNTGEKVRAMDGHKINEGQLFANLRNFPEALASGDTIEQLLG